MQILNRALPIVRWPLIASLTHLNLVGMSIMSRMKFRRFGWNSNQQCVSETTKHLVACNQRR